MITNRTSRDYAEALLGPVLRTPVLLGDLSINHPVRYVLPGSIHRF